MKLPLVAAALLPVAVFAQDTPAPVSAAVVATPSWGAALSLSAPVELNFGVGAYTQAWKRRNAGGGAKIEGDPDGARAFVIDLDNGGGENVASGSALRFDGRAVFRQAADGAVEAEWTAVPDRDAALPEVMVETKIPLSRVAGGFLADGREVAIPDSTPESPHLFRGPVSRLEARGADGKALFAVDFPDTAEILVQDNREWGNPVATLRFFLAEKSVTTGKPCRLRARFSAPGRGIALEEPDPVVIEAGPDWIPFPVAAPGEDWTEPGSALDLSLSIPRHEPAGAFGRVVAVGDHFELEGRPGEEIRFCGVNLVHGGNTPSVECADRFAANLARMGFNSVRLHHHERPLLKKGDPAALAIDPDAQDRFDALVAACVRHGLYLTTDLYVSRVPVAWRAVGIDRDGMMAKEDYKMAAAFHEGVFSNLLAWTRAFMLHVNPYTGRSLAEEPALATLALVNEGNLGNLGLEPLLRIPGVEEAWRAWCAGRDVPEDIRSAPLQDLPHTLYGDASAKPRFVDLFTVFLAETELKLYRRLETFLREEIGCQAPLSNLSSWYNPEVYSVARAAFDYDDDHGYVDHPSFLGKKWRLPASSNGLNPLSGGDGVPQLAWRRLNGKPFCVTEWNWAAPGAFRAASGLVMGALAARQGWAGLWRFAWSHDRHGVEAPGSVRMRYFDLHADPTQCASERAALCLFLRGDLAPLPAGEDGFVHRDAAALLRGENASVRMLPPAKAASGWEKRIGRSLDVGASTSPAPLPVAGGGLAGGTTAVDPVRGSFLVDTPRTAGGFAPGGHIDAGPLSFDIGPAEVPVPAAVWASTVDGRPFAETSRILLSHVTETRNTGARFDDPAMRIWTDFGQLPALARRGVADVSIALPGIAARETSDGAAPAHWTVFRLSPTGRRLWEVPSSCDRATGRLSFTARTDWDPAAATFCYEIVADVRDATLFLGLEGCTSTRRTPTPTRGSSAGRRQTAGRRSPGRGNTGAKPRIRASAPSSTASVDRCLAVYGNLPLNHSRCSAAISTAARARS